MTAAGCRTALRPGKPYFIEFRSRTAASYGHTFLFHGRLTPGGGFGKFQVAGLHPAGDSASTYMMGHLVPVKSDTGASDGDLDEQYMTARFCVTLTEAEYVKAAAYIRQLQASSPTWHAGTSNCNGFAGDVARFIGLKAPLTSLKYPKDYINEMKALNTGPQHAGAPTGSIPVN